MLKLCLLKIILAQHPAAANTLPPHHYELCMIGPYNEKVESCTKIKPGSVHFAFDKYYEQIDCIRECKTKADCFKTVLK